MIEWKRIPRKGFVLSHWYGEGGGLAFKIEQRRVGSRLHKHWVTSLFVLPNGLAQSCENVADAKVRAHFLAFGEAR